MFTRLEQTHNGTYKYQKEDINKRSYDKFSRDFHRLEGKCYLDQQIT